MKNIFALSIVAASLVLTACGGGSSDSSGGSTTSSFSKTLANGNQYSCPTKTSFDSCTSDTSCKAATCTITKQVATPVDTTTSALCEVTATNVYGKNGSSCKYVTATANATLTCSNNTLYIDGKIGNLTSSNSSFGSGFTDGTTGLKFTCK